MARQTKAKQEKKAKEVDVKTQDSLGVISSGDAAEQESSDDSAKPPVGSLTEPVVSSPSIGNEVSSKGVDNDPVTTSSTFDANADSGVMTDEDLLSDEDVDDADNLTSSKGEVKTGNQSGVAPSGKGRKLIVCYDEADKNKFLQLCQERHLQYDGELILSTEMSSISACDEVKFAFTDILKISHYGELVLREAFQIKSESRPQSSDDAAVTLESFASSDVEPTGSSVSFNDEIDNFAELISNKIESKRSFKVTDF